MNPTSEDRAAPRVGVVGAVIERDGAVLMARRPPGRRHAGLWEFPGGKVEPGEVDAPPQARELIEELAAPGVVGDLVAEGGDERVVLACYRVRLLADPIPLFHDQLAWIPIAQLRGIETPPADQATVQALA
jgi:8-oxo-dGTP diphosphatase